MKNKKRTTKRILSLLIAMVMLLGMATVYADETETSTKTYGEIFSQNFEGEHSSTQINTYFDIYGNMRGYKKVGSDYIKEESNAGNVYGLGSKSLAIHSSSTVYTWKPLDESTLTYVGRHTDSTTFAEEGENVSVVTEFDMKIPAGAQRGAYAQLMYHGTNTTEYGGQVLFSLNFDVNAGKIMYKSEFSSTEIELADIKTDEWHRYRIVQNVTSGTKSLGTLDLYIDGVNVLDDYTYTKNSANYSGSKYDLFRIITATANSGTVTTDQQCAFDNITIYKSNASNPMPVNDGQLLSAIRTADTAYAAMEDGDSKTKYATAIAAAKTAFEASDRTDTSLAAYDALINWETAEPEEPEDTTGPIYTINGIVLRDASGNEVDGIAPQGDIYRVRFTKNREWAEDSKLIVAIYQNGKLIKLRTKDISGTLKVGEESVITLSASFQKNITNVTVKVFIWSDITSTFIPQSEFYNYSKYYVEETVATAAVPLYESVSVYVEQSEPVDECKVFYKKETDASWSQAYSAEYNHREGNYSTSIVDLEENTKYDISVELYNNGMPIAIGSTTFTTLSSNPPIAREISIKDIYTEGTMLDLTGYCGTADGWIKIKGDGKTVVDVGEYSSEKEDYLQSVLCNNTHYVILEDLIIKGGLRYGVYIDESCSNIRMVGCDISAWSELGILKETDKSTEENVKVAYFSTIPGKESIQVRGSAIYAYCDDLTIERCFIHDSNAKVNPWNGTDAETGLTWTGAHPEGPNGISVNGSRMVIRYNDIVGSEHFRLNDCITSGNNFSNGGFIADCDIYGNMFALANDDAVELDGGAKNVRFHHNRIFATYSGISTIDNYTGPSFVFNNVSHDLRDSSNIAFYHTKNAIENKDGDADTKNFGVTHFFYNTFYTNLYESLCGIYSVGKRPYHAVSRNNIILGGQTSKDQIANFADENSKSSYDYDLLGNYANKTDNYKGIINLPESYTNGREENAIFGLPAFVNKDVRDFRLTEESLGYGVACAVEGFKGQNMGALDIEGNGLIPSRLLDMTISANFIELKQDGSSTFSLTSNAEETMEFSILMNDKNSPFTITCTSGKNSIEPAETLVFEVVADGVVDLNGGYDSRGYYYYDGIAFIKFSNGHSLPVCLRIKE